MRVAVVKNSFFGEGVGFFMVDTGKNYGRKERKVCISSVGSVCEIKLRL
jgi:hypothetical protein